ncbi:MAG: histidine--tRNA ligase [Planctomycetota bacterium]
MAKQQAPKGTRDFYPAAMAWHQHLLEKWRAVSVRNGFEQVDGPIFEKLDLYKIKSGEGIVSELFSFRRDQGKTDFAIRPEFTPTLARMVAEQANSLPKPIKWFATPNFCRAERPQRGRLREFWQWNVDLLGLDTPAADAEVIFTLVDFLADCGLTPQQVRIKVSHRDVVSEILTKLGVPEAKLPDAFDLLDARDKMPPDVFTENAGKLGLSEAKVQRFEEVCRRKYPAGDLDHLARSLAMDAPPADLAALDAQLAAFGIADWCEYDLGIVRGLAYYTGTVFEAHEAAGVERAIAGGGRYDRLIELFGGPPTPAVGFGLGDVVLTNVLQDKGLLPDDVLPRPDAFVFATSDDAAARLPGAVATLRRAGRHARMSYKAGRNVGKLLKDAEKARARFAVIVGDGDAVEIKNLDTGDQHAVPAAGLLDAVPPAAAVN